MIGITGAKGVLGRIICQKLESQNLDFSIFNDDIRNENAVFEWLKSDNISYVIHLASKVAVSDVENNIAEAYEVNVSGTINLIKAIGKLNQPIGIFYIYLLFNCTHRCLKTPKNKSKRGRECQIKKIIIVVHPHLVTLIAKANAKVFF